MCLTFLIVGLFEARGEAAGVLESRFTAGAGGQAVESMDIAASNSSGTVGGLGATLYSEQHDNSSVSGYRASLSHAFDMGTFGLRGLYYPRLSKSQAVGGTFFFNLPSRDPEMDYQGTWGLSASWVQQSARSRTTAPPKRVKRFGEGVVEFSTRQTYFDDFNFLLTGAYFYYDRSLGPIRQFRTTFLHADVAMLGTFFALTEPPRWNVSLQYSRAFGSAGRNNVVIGYSRIGLYEASRNLNSYLLGVQGEILEPLRLEVGCNIVEGSASAYKSYWAATLAYYWR